MEQIKLLIGKEEAGGTCNGRNFLCLIKTHRKNLNNKETSCRYSFSAKLFEFFVCVRKINTFQLNDLCQLKEEDDDDDHTTSRCWWMYMGVDHHVGRPRSSHWHVQCTTSRYSTSTSVVYNNRMSCRKARSLESRECATSWQLLRLRAEGNE